MASLVGMPEWAHNYITAVGLGLGTIELGKRALTDTVMGIPRTNVVQPHHGYRDHQLRRAFAEFAAQAELPRGLQARPE